MHTPVRHRSYIAPSSLRRRGNPYFTKRRNDKIQVFGIKNILARIPTRGWFWIFLTLLIISGLIWLLFFSSVFTIKYVEVKNANLTSSASIEADVFNQTDTKRVFIFSQNRLFVFSSRSLRTALIDKYSLQDVKVIKKLPSTLIIELTERQAAAVWFEADQYLLLDASGHIISTSSATTNLGLPLIRNNGLPKINNQQVEVDPSVIASAKQVFEDFPPRFSWITIKEMDTNNEDQTLILAANKGPLIYFNTTDNIDQQLVRLDTLLRSDVRARFAKLSYIDLRFGDKLYYK